MIYLPKHRHSNVIQAASQRLQYELTYTQMKR